MRADRLLSILLLLQNRGRMTSRELADKLEVSERTIVRDMEALSIAGIPVYAVRGSGGGWALTEGYETNLTGMKTKELLSLMLAKPTNLLRDLGIKHDFESAYEKLLASSPAEIRQNADLVRQRIHIDGAGWHQSQETFAYLSTVQEAVWAERKLYMQYKKNDTVVERIVHPLGIVAMRHIWYVVAEANHEFRSYRISRIAFAEMLDEAFERPADFELETYWEHSKLQFKQTLPRYPVKLKILQSAVQRLRHERYITLLDSDPVADEQGWAELAVECETLESACEIILSYGSLIEVLEPFELREKIINELKAIGSRYGLHVQ